MCFFFLLKKKKLTFIDDDYIGLINILKDEQRVYYINKEFLIRNMK